MAAIGGNSLGLITGYAILDQESGDIKTIKDLFSTAGGTPGPKGDKGDKGDTGTAGTAGAAGRGVVSVAASKTGTVVTLTFTMSDSTTETATFDLA